MKDKEFELDNQRELNKSSKISFFKKDLKKAFLAGKDTDDFEKWFSKMYKNGTG